VIGVLGSALLFIATKSDTKTFNLSVQYPPNSFDKKIINASTTIESEDTRYRTCTFNGLGTASAEAVSTLTFAACRTGNAYANFRVDYTAECMVAQNETEFVPRCEKSNNYIARAI